MPQPDRAGQPQRRHPAPIGDIIAAQDSGAAAYGAGEPVSTCPFRGRTDAASAFLRQMWVKGWTTARMVAENTPVDAAADDG